MPKSGGLWLAAGLDGSKTMISSNPCCSPPITTILSDGGSLVEGRQPSQSAAQRIRQAAPVTVRAANRTTSPTRTALTTLVAVIPTASRIPNYPAAILKATHRNTGVTVMIPVICRNAATTPKITLAITAAAVQVQRKIQ